MRTAGSTMKRVRRLLLVFLFCITVLASTSSAVEEENSLLAPLATRRQLLTENCNPVHHNHDAVKASAAKARAMLERQPTAVPIQDRLLVMVLFSRGFLSSGSSYKSRLEYLKCSLAKLQENLGNTTLDVFIWTLNQTNNHPVVPDWLTHEKFPRVNVIEIEDISWKIPCGLIDDSQWVVRKHFDVDYYMMGRWRLAFSLDFAKEMGYKYHLQFDDDAMINNKLQYNLVQKLQTDNHFMAVFSDMVGEVPHVTLGLPELTTFWLKMHKYTPKGNIFKHTKPHDMSGLTSEGWDRMYHPGYFIIISVDFWFLPEIQDYLTTVFRSGRDIEGRWQEQAVMNMIRLVFIPEKHLLVMSDIDIGHDRHKRANFENWCVKSGVMERYA